MLLFTTAAIGMDSGRVVPLEHLEQGFTAEPSISAGDAIWRKHVHPHDLVLNFKAAALFRWAQSMGTEFECS